MTNTTKQLTPAEAFKADLQGLSKTIKNLVSDAHFDELKFLSAAVNMVRSVPRLLDCERGSLMDCLLECARIGLLPSNSQGECYILPYYSRKKQQYFAQLQIGYKGFVTLFYRCGVSTIASYVVKEKDDFEFALGLEPKLHHIPHLGADAGEPIAAYAVAELNGKKIFKVMSKSDVEKIKAMSDAKESNYSPWNKNDPEYWMWQKTVIKQLAKLLPKTESIHRAIEYDNIGERGGYFINGKMVEAQPFQPIEEGLDKKAKLRAAKKETKKKPSANPPQNEQVREDASGQAGEPSE